MIDAPQSKTLVVVYDIEQLTGAELESLLTLAFNAAPSTCLHKFNVYTQPLAEVFAQLEVLWVEGGGRCTCVMCEHHRSAEKLRKEHG